MSVIPNLLLAGTTKYDGAPRAERVLLCNRWRGALSANTYPFISREVKLDKTG